jgi:hypothetical protein
MKRAQGLCDEQKNRDSPDDVKVFQIQSVHVDGESDLDL